MPPAGPESVVVTAVRAASFDGSSVAAYSLYRFSRNDRNWLIHEPIVRAATGSSFGPRNTNTAARTTNSFSGSMTRGSSARRVRVGLIVVARAVEFFLGRADRSRELGQLGAAEQH